MTMKRLLLAPGASGSVASLEPHRRGLEAKGLSVGLVELPRGRAERALPVYRSALEANAAIGGHSFGGRVASLLAAEEEVAALILLSYPLHAPGRREAWEERTAHWPRITCPVLLLSGESDPFATLDLLRRAVSQLPNATLITFPRLGHGLAQVLDEALDEVASFMAANT